MSYDDIWQGSVKVFSNIRKIKINVWGQILKDALFSFVSKLFILASPCCPMTLSVLLIVLLQLSSVQFSRSVVSDSWRPHCSTPGLPVLHHLLEFTQTHFHRVRDVIQPSHPGSSPSPSAPNLSQHQSLFQWVNSLHQVAKVFSFSISPSNEHPGLISFRMDWLALLAVQGTLKSLLQHHSSKASILWHSAFFTVQLSHPYLTTGKTIALTRRTFVGKVVSLLFNMLSSV